MNLYPNALSNKITKISVDLINQPCYSYYIETGNAPKLKIKRNIIMTNKITELQKEIKDVQNKINNFELNPEDFIDSYDEMLDEVEGDFMGYCASRILRELDPIAYRCGLLDYLDSFDIEDSEEYQDYVSQLEELENELEELESE